jgi:hypothetical protein
MRRWGKSKIEGWGDREIGRDGDEVNSRDASALA